MRVSFVTGCLMTAFVLAASLSSLRTASAADLDGERYAEPPYDEGAYGNEEYGDDESNPPPAGYGERYGEAPPSDRDYGYDDRASPEPPRGSIKDGYPVPMPPPRAEAPPPPPRYVERPPVRVDRYACLDRWQIRRRLRGEGWSGIRPMGGNGGIVDIRARRFDSSSMFHLRVDRCSGAVLTARPEFLRTFAYRERPYHERPWRYGY
jgi:hypothetical protein